MRARLALFSAGIRVELREILLRDKPQAFLRASPSATVPCLVLDDRVLDESADIMVWALRKNDPQGLLQMPQDGWHLIKANDGPFKAALDHTKYASRYPQYDREVERTKAADFLAQLDARLKAEKWLFGTRQTIADQAIFPFVRQFANIDRSWFDSQGWAGLADWLDRQIASDAFAQIMIKYTPWADGDSPVWFGGRLEECAQESGPH